MTKLRIPYGRHFASAEIAGRLLRGLRLAAGAVRRRRTPDDIWRARLSTTPSAMSSRRAPARLSPSPSMTRLAPSRTNTCCPRSLHGMRHAGVHDEDVVFIIATGTHPRMSPDEFSAVLPREIRESYRVLCHDAADDDQPDCPRPDFARDAGFDQQRSTWRPIIASSSAISNRTSSRASPAASKARPSAWQARRPSTTTTP